MKVPAQSLPSISTIYCKPIPILPHSLSQVFATICLLNQSNISFLTYIMIFAIFDILPENILICIITSECYSLHYVSCPYLSAFLDYVFSVLCLRGDEYIHGQYCCLSPPWLLSIHQQKTPDRLLQLQILISIATDLAPLLPSLYYPDDCIVC